MLTPWMLAPWLGMFSVVWSAWCGGMSRYARCCLGMLTAHSRWYFPLTKRPIA